MKRFIIRDGTDTPRGGLEFDLAEVLAALGPRGLSCRWEARGLNYVSRDEKDIPTLDALATDGSIRGDELVESLPNLLQVIDGEFRAVDGEQDPWVVVRAVDSSWWEVLSDDPSIEVAVRSRFRTVEEASDGLAA